MKNLKLLFRAVLNRKRYDNILPLGYNCETAYRFYRHFKFVESSLFAWVAINSFESLMKALNNLEELAQHELNYDSGMFKCSFSEISFHGKTSASKIVGDEQTVQNMIQADMEELRPRIKYLSEKFKKTLNDGKTNLFIKKISKTEAEDEKTYDKILELHALLSRLCRNKFDLLLVVEKDFYDKFLYEKDGIYTRCVEKYSPDSAVSDKKAGDKFGWNLIFTEFCPKKRVWKIKKKKLKFEEV